jgi:hypothetical protein
MVWVPKGALIAGTPPGHLPRIADEEMPGEQVILEGFFIDSFAYPNEEGAIPQTGATQGQASSLCEEQGKRLCTELEWERACKGPSNFTYEYGDRYRADRCMTGRAPRMLPSGHRVGCQSQFGARDMHGSVWEWTRSRWGRGTSRELYTVRGGNAAVGELVGRCANAMARPPGASSSQVGFRCCKGEPNSAEVSLHIETGPALKSLGKVDAALAKALGRAIPESARQLLAGYGTFTIKDAWDWRPIGNVHLVAGAGCAGAGAWRRCGVVIASLLPGQPTLMAWVWSGKFAPVVKIRGDARKLWVYGGDRMSHFRQAAIFEWGSVRLGDIERNIRD